MEVQIMGSQKFVKDFSPCQKHRSNKKDVRIMGSQTIESQL